MTTGCWKSSEKPWNTGILSTSSLDIVERDDALVGGQKPGQRGRGEEGKVSVLIAFENRDGKPGYPAMETVDSVSKTTVLDFAKRRIKVAQTEHTDGLSANNGISPHVTHVSKITSPELDNEWLTWAHVDIANLKRFLLGRFHGTSNRYSQDSLNEFHYHLYLRFWEAEIPNRLLRLCVVQRSVACCGTVS